MNKLSNSRKVITIIVILIMICLSPASNIGAYTDGELIFENTMTIDANEYLSKVITLSSEYDPDRDDDGLRINSTTFDVNSNLRLVLLLNESTSV